MVCTWFSDGAHDKRCNEPGEQDTNRCKLQADANALGKDGLEIFRVAAAGIFGENTLHGIIEPVARNSKDEVEHSRNARIAQCSHTYPAEKNAVDKHIQLRNKNGKGDGQRDGQHLPVGDLHFQVI